MSLNFKSENGRSDVIFDINNQSDKPGYGYQLKMGATSQRPPAEPEDFPWINCCTSMPARMNGPPPLRSLVTIGSPTDLIFIIPQRASQPPSTFMIVPFK